jgi:hypothetical protein
MQQRRDIIVVYDFSDLKSEILGGSLKPGAKKTGRRILTITSNELGEYFDQKLE